MPRSDALADPIQSYGDMPAVLLVSDDEGASIAAAIAAAGGRPIPVAVEEAAARFDRQIGPPAVLVTLADDPGEAFDALIDRLNAAPDVAALLIVPMRLTDRAFAAITSSEIVLLVAPDAVERELEIALLVGRAGRRAEPLVAEPSARLRQLSDEMVRIAQLLGSLSAEITELRATLPAAERGAPAEPSAGTIRGIIRARRLRDRFFGPEMFADPAWDMLLDLMAARLEGHEVAVSSLCIAAAVPPTTALRWIRTLTEAGLFVRRADPDDRRRVFIEISERASVAMASYLAAAKAAAALLV